MYKAEKYLYPDICKWFKFFLEQKFRQSKIQVADTSRKNLSKWLVENKLHEAFPDYQTYEIEVDVSGVIESSKEVHLAFVECKLGKITLRDISQLLGYSRVALPVYSFIISPKGISQSLNSLFNIFRRNDVLYYSKDKHVIIGKWDERRKDLNLNSIIPKGFSI